MFRPEKLRLSSVVLMCIVWYLFANVSERPSLTVCDDTDDGVADWPSVLRCADNQCRVASVFPGVDLINHKVGLEKNEN